MFDFAETFLNLSRRIPTVAASERIEGLAALGGKTAVTGLAAGAGFAGGVMGANYMSGPNAQADQTRGVVQTVSWIAAGILGFAGFKAGKGLLNRVAPNGVVNKVMSGATREVGAIGKGIYDGARSIERNILRPLLTGTSAKSVGALDAYFPYFNQIADKNDIRRFALNPRIMRRAIGLNAAVQVASIPAHGLYNPTPPPSAYYDGTSTRHVNDMGIDSGFASKMMGARSNSLY